MKPILLSCLLLAASQWVSAQKLHTPEEVADLMRQSSVQFIQDSMPASDWKPNRPIPHDDDVYYIRIEDEEGVRLQILDKAYDKKTQKALRKGDKAFRKEKWAKSLECYLEAQGRKPADPRITQKVGSVYQRMDDPPTALYWYAKSLSLNSGDADAWWQSARCHRLLGDLKQALDHIIYAHLLDRNNLGIQQDVLLIFKENDIPFSIRHFSPQYALLGVPDKQVRVGYTHPVWQAYANVMALWIYDTAYAKSMAGISGHGDKDAMTKEALLNTLVIYERLKEPNKAEEFPFLALLSGISLERQVSPFVWYEILSVQDPRMFLRADREIWEQVKTYLLEYRVGL